MGSLRWGESCKRFIFLPSNWTCCSSKYKWEQISCIFSDITAQHISDSSALPAPCDQTHVIWHSRARKSQAPKFYSVSCLSIFRTYFFSNSVSLPLLHRFCMMRLSVHRRQTSLCNPTDFDAKRVSQAASGLTKCRSLDEALRNYWGWEHHGARHVHEGTGRGIP